MSSSKNVIGAPDSKRNNRDRLRWLVLGCASRNLRKRHVQNHRMILDKKHNKGRCLNRVYQQARLGDAFGLKLCANKQAKY